MIYDKDFLNTAGKESQSSVVAILAEMIPEFCE